ncbi:Ig-like domain-containing protein, partial [Marinomonas transparens]
MADTITIDSVIDDVGSKQGSFTSDVQTDDKSLLLSGTTEAGSTVKIYKASTGEFLGDATVTGANWTYPAELNEGDKEYQFIAKATDAAGNVVGESSGFKVTLDTVAPFLITLEAVTDDVGEATGPVSSGEITDDTSLELSGFVEPGSKVFIYNGATKMGEATVEGIAWTYDAELANGMTYNLTAKAMDSAGNEADTPDFIVRVVDVPKTPTFLVTDNVGSVTGTLETGKTTDDTSLELSGTVETGSTVAIYSGEIKIGDAVVIGENWTYIVDLKHGSSYQFKVKTTDVAGNESEFSSDFNVKADTRADSPSITFESAGADDVYNAAELGVDGTVTATISVTDSDVGDTLTYNVNGIDTLVTLNAEQIANGIAIEVHPEDSVTATLSDVAGNVSTEASETVVSADISAEAGSVGVNAITEDDVINAAESGQTVAVTGSAAGGDIAAGDLVTMTINGTDYSTTVQADNTWSVDVAGSDLANDTAFEAVVTSSDAAGNTVISTGASTHTVDLSAEEGTVGVNAITEDDVINAAESGQTIAVTGSAEGGDIVAGDLVTMTINDTDYSTTVQADNTWSVDIAGSDLAADTAFDAVVTSSDEAGNTVESLGSSTHTVDLSAEEGTVDVNAITPDDVINAAESGQTVAVTGSAAGGDIAAGDVVTMTINDTDYSTTVQADNTWSVDVAGSDLANDTAFDAVVTSSDAAGNTVESIGASTHTVDLSAEAGSVNVNAITEDDVINANEVAGTVSVTGSAAGGDIAAGDLVTMTINGTDYSTAVQADDTWSVDVAGSDLANDTAFDAVVTSSDAAGNTVDTVGASTHTVDLSAEAGNVNVNAITEDDVINAAESGQTIAVTGSAAGGDIAAGDLVTMTINGTDYSTTVQADNTWSVDVAGSDLANDTAFDAVVTSSDAAGNTVDTVGASTHTVDLSAEAGNVNVNAITEDDVINAAESGQTIAVTGSAAGGDIAAGDLVTMTINGTDYSTTVQADNTWSVDVAGSDLANDTAFDAVVTSSDAAGNTVDTVGASTHTVDLSAEAGNVNVNAITEDDVINAAESGQTIAVTGSAAGGDIAAGDLVTMTINGTDYSTTVQADNTWSVDVAGSDLANDTAFDAVVTSSDAAGNTVDTVGASTHTVDLSAEAGNVNVNAITEDDVINAAESGQTVAVTGSAAGGDIAAGDLVTMTINGTDYSTTVQADNTWSVDVAGSDLANDTAFDAVVTSSDAAGNTVESIGASTHTVDLSAEAGSVNVNAITEDDVINANEVAGTVSVTGSAAGGDIAAGDLVTMTINGTDYSTAVQADDTWSVDVAGSDLANDTAFDAVVTSSDAAGNTVDTVGASTHTVDLSAEAGNVNVNAITEDDVINAAESGQTVAVTGSAAGGDIAAGDLVTMTINGTDYSTTVQADNTWSVDVAGSDLANDTAFDAVVTSSDEAGNTVDTVGASTHTVDLSAEAGTVGVNAITEDDVINANEAAGTISVTGSAAGGDIAAGDLVTMTINGTDYSTTVQADNTWSVDVAGSDLANDTAFEAVVTSSDAAGNTVISTGASTHTVDLSAEEGTVGVNAITEDDVINAAESGQTIAVTGSAEGGDIVAGDLVTMTINDTDYSTTVQADNTWSVDIAGSDLAADTAFDAVVTSSDEAGNTVESLGSSTHTVDLSAEEGTVDVNAITPDDVINAAESGQTVAVTGSAAGGDIAAGDVVTMTINDTDYSTTVQADNTWSVDVAGSDLANDTAFDAVVTSSDAAGNTVESIGASTHTVDLSAEAGSVNVNAITEDDVINANEAAGTVSVTGSAEGGDIAAGDVVTMTINGTDYSTT